jgi:hypothetical protein
MVSRYDFCWVLQKEDDSPHKRKKKFVLYCRGSQTVRRGALGRSGEYSGAPQGAPIFCSPETKFTYLYSQ